MFQHMVRAQSKDANGCPQLLLGALTIGPWFLLIVYDAVLYIFRTATYDFPYIGGRARNRPRPRAPSLSERPSGRARTFSLTVPGVSTTAVAAAEETVEGLKRRMEGSEHRRSNSQAVEDE